MEAGLRLEVEVEEDATALEVEESTELSVLTLEVRVGEGRLRGGIEMGS